MIEDLCLVSDLRDTLGLQGTTDVSLVQRYATSASAFFSKETNRTFTPKTYTEQRNGTGTEILVLRNDPIIKILALSVDTVFLNPSTGPSVFGYVVDGPAIILTGGWFARGTKNVLCSYFGGYGAEAIEGYAIASGTVVVENDQWFYGVVSVADMSGTTFIQVPENPAVGQYSVSSDTGTFTFNSADNGRSILIDYWYRMIPGDLQQVVIEIAAQKYKRRAHTDQDSQILNGQNIQFSKTDVPREARTVIDNYMRRGFWAA